MFWMWRTSYKSLYTVSRSTQLAVLSHNCFHSLITSCLFLSFIARPLHPTDCRCRGLLLHLITLRHTTLGRTPLDGGSAHHRELYLTTFARDKHLCPRRDSNLSPPPSDQPQTHALDGTSCFWFPNFVLIRPQTATEAMFIFKRKVISLHDCKGGGGLTYASESISRNVATPFQDFYRPTVTASEHGKRTNTCVDELALS